VPPRAGQGKSADPAAAERLLGDRGLHACEMRRVGTGTRENVRQTTPFFFLADGVRASRRSRRSPRRGPASDFDGRSFSDIRLGSGGTLPTATAGAIL
jgi:hypothetical protein